jgi:hypothetical protein
MKRQTPAIVLAYLAGLLFGVGLVVGGMTQPAKVVGFLDLAGDWDPSLAFVMGGALAVVVPAFRWITRRGAPVCATGFAVPTRRDIDAPLIAGALLFGAGWGLAGYCPGPAITAAASFAPGALLFVAAMLAGFALKRGHEHLRSRRAVAADASTPVARAS